MTRPGRSLPPQPVLHLLAGPNGSGKSTFVDRLLQPSTHLPFVNADVMARELWSGDEAAHAYDASRAAAAERRRRMAAGESFISETVFSHRSKVDLVAEAVGAGYRVHLHVVVVPLDNALGRVRFRVDHRIGTGHAVPRHKVIERYERLWPLVVEAAEIADRTDVYDNSSAERPFRLVATCERGQLGGQVDWPTWFPAPVRRLTG